MPGDIIYTRANIWNSRCHFVIAAMASSGFEAASMHVFDRDAFKPIMFKK